MRRLGGKSGTWSGQGCKQVLLAMLSLGLSSVLAACGGVADDGASSTKIVGGAEVAARDIVAKSTVALLQPSGWQFCSGSLIGKRLVVTASHCLVDYQDKSLLVAFGLVASSGEPPVDGTSPAGDPGADDPGGAGSSQDPGLPDFTGAAGISGRTADPQKKAKAATHPGQGKAVPVAAITRHAVAYATNKDYDLAAIQEEHPDLPPNDIALVLLAADAPRGFAPVPVLKRSDKLVVGEALTLAGFGLTAADGGSSGTLRKVTTKILSLSSSAEELEFGDTPGKSSCMGDSGGPAFVERAGKLKLVGITSRGAIGCIGEGVYTDVRYFHPWLKRAEGAMMSDEAARHGRHEAKPVLYHQGV